GSRVGDRADRRSVVCEHGIGSGKGSLVLLRTEGQNPAGFPTRRGFALGIATRLQQPLRDFICSRCCSATPRPGSSRRASLPKPPSCRQAANGCMKSSTTAFGSSLEGRGL